MKLVTFTRNGVTHIGKLIGEDSVVDLNEAQPALPMTMLGFLQSGDAALMLAEQVPATQSYPLSSVKLHAPIPNPGKIICIGLNYSDHAAETGQALPKF